MNDLISRQAAIDAKQEFRNPNVVRNTEARTAYDRTYANGWNDCNSAWINAIKALPSAQPEQRYTEEELRVFAHGISLSLLSKRSAQHWRYDKDTATEIEFLERLYDKVVADMGDEQDDSI